MQPSYAPGYLALIASTAFGRIGAGMIAGPGFSVPHEIDEILERLPPQLTLNVPDHVLALWFPREPADGVIDAPTLERARRYAQRCDWQGSWAQDVCRWMRDEERAGTYGSH